MERPAVRRGAWSSEEDRKLTAYVKKYVIWNWNQMPKFAGLSRSGKSCRLRWINYLRPDVKLGKFNEEEDETIIKLHEKLGNRWSEIARQLPGRTDNEIKNHWHTRLKKRLCLTLKKNIVGPITKAEAGEKSNACEEPPQKNSPGRNVTLIINDDHIGNTEISRTSMSGSIVEDPDPVNWTQPFLTETSSMEDQEFGYGDYSQFDGLGLLGTSSFFNDFCFESLDFLFNLSETEDVISYI